MKSRALIGSEMRSNHSRIFLSIPGIDRCLRKEELDILLFDLCLFRSRKADLVPRVYESKFSQFTQQTMNQQEKL